MSIRRLLWMMVVAGSWASGARATVLLPADLGVISHDARAIARGRVVAVDSNWTDDRRAVETSITIDVESYLKGSLGSTLTFRVPGGRLGRYRSIIAGAPEFAVGQRLIVFLGYHAPGVPYLLGLGQGVYRIRPAGSTWNVIPPAVVSSGTAQPVVRGDPARRPLTLAAFERQVKVLVGSVR